MGDTIYYGTTQFGHRIHLGTEVLFPEANNPDKWVVWSHCGNRVESHDPDRPTPAKVTEFCRNCFRAEAWQVYEAALLKEAEAHATA